MLAAYDAAHVGPPGGARKLIEEAPAVAVPKWISVAERLPEKSGQYLTYETWVYGRAIYTSYWTNSYQDKSEVEMYGRALWYRYDSEYGDYEVNRITHWMPLPEPPEVDT